MLKLIVTMILAVLSSAKAPGNVYSAWTDDGLHLMISDAGTPEDLEDDFICDWEDNRIFEIRVYE